MSIRIFISSIALLLCTLSLSADANKTIVTVNGKAVTQSMLDRQVATLMPRSYYHASVNTEKMQVLEKKALEEIIDAILYMQYAYAKGYGPSEAETEKLYEEVVSTISPQQLAVALKSSNLNVESFKQELAERLAVQNLFEKEIKMTFSDDELKSYYEANKHKFVIPGKAKVRVIYTKNEPTDVNGSLKARKLANELYDKLMNGADFAELATKYSDAMSRINGGDMGFVHDGTLSSDFNDEAFKLKKGEISPVIEREMGCYIVKVEDTKPSQQLTFEEIKVKLAKERKESIEKKRLAALLEKLKKDAVIVTND